jgi:hypothetical protein
MRPRVLSVYVKLEHRTSCAAALAPRNGSINLATDHRGHPGRGPVHG